MKVSVTQENLVKALNYVVKATALKPNIPVLANILIKTEAGKVKFAATDLDISISAWIGGDISEEGELTVNARLLTEFVGQLKSSRIELIQSGQTLEVKSVDNQAQLVIITPDDFPTLPEAERDADLVINARDFQEAVAKTSFATASDQSRPVLTGLLLETTERKASFVGVDGFRLSRKFVNLVKGSPESMKLVIPAKALVEMAKIAADSADEDDNVNVFYLKERNQVLFKLNEVVFSTRILEGEFPDYKQIIPSESNIELSVSKKELTGAVKVASIFARNVIGNKTLFRIDPEEKLLKLSARVQDMGTNDSQVELDSVTGDSYETAYNAKFLADMINSIEGDEIQFATGGVTSPGVFRDPEDESFLHIIMPMRIE